MARAERTRRLARTWRGRIARQRRTGEAVKAYCRREKVSTASFYAWRRKLAGTSRRRARLVPVRVVETGGRPVSDCVVETVLSGGRMVRIRAETDALAGVIRALEGAARC